VGRYWDDDEPLSFTHPWLAFAFVGWALAYFWLSVSVDWPEECKPSGRRVAGIISEYFCSPVLMEAGPTELALFCVLWGFPATLILAAVWFRFFRRNTREEPG
jgi:hypothetical protein